MRGVFLNPAKAEGAKNPLIVFFHAQRTGGRAFRHAMAQVYGRERIFAVQWHGSNWRHWKHLSEDDLDGYVAFVGHSNYTDIGIRQRDCLLVSLVRHPVSRLISLYGYIRNREDHELWELANSREMFTFYEEAFTLKPYYLQNVQCRRICGRPKAELAIQFIEKAYLAVGSVEDLPGFVDAIGSVLSWPKLELVSIPPDAERYADIWTTEFEELVLEGNSEDLRLYDYLRREYFQRD